jgi:phage shock protein B
VEEVLIPLFAIVAVFGTPVLIVWIILHYSHKNRKERSAAAPGGLSNGELARLAERMEQRIEALEAILDTEAPGWRKKNEHR